MNKYALIKSGVVSNVVLGDDLWVDSIRQHWDNIVKLNENDRPNKGQQWIEGEGFITEEYVESEDVHTWKITKLAFKNRFPRSKWKAARQAATVNADFYDFFESFELATYIDLALPETIVSVTAMSAEGVPVEIKLTPEEVTAVIATPAQPYEIPK